jgi:energy-coupling factor transporter ATP-binding protein EcfA2
LAARDRSYRLVTAIVPGGPSPFDPRLAFLGAYPWADLRDGVDAGTDRVVRALSGHATQRLGEATDLECPYPGLEAFDEEQASDFFGREREIEQVVEQLEASRFIAIVGASGSGKSSLVRAGVVPRLRRDADDRTTVITVVPGASPIAALSAALAATLGLSQADVAAALDDEGGLDRLVGATDPPLRLVVVVDQFEEVFTLCPDPAERERFMSTLAYAATVPDGAVSVIIACRADFVHRLAEHDGLRQLAAAHQLSLGTMSAANLRDAIERPARRMGVDLEPGLTRRILTDLPREAGSLPLLGHLLRELWERRSADTLTLAAYDTAGGVGGALARHADSVMADMTDDQREIARRLLLRLTQPGDGTEDTRRRATKSELLSIGDPETVEPVLARLTAGRLVST